MAQWGASTAVPTPRTLRDAETACFQVLTVDFRRFARSPPRLRLIQLDDAPSIEADLVQRREDRVEVHTSAAELDKAVSIVIGGRLDVLEMQERDAVAVGFDRFRRVAAAMLVV